MIIRYVEIKKGWRAWHVYVHTRMNDTSEYRIWRASFTEKEEARRFAAQYCKDWDCYILWSHFFWAQ